MKIVYEITVHNYLFATIFTLVCYLGVLSWRFVLCRSKSKKKKKKREGKGEKKDEE